MTRAGYRLTRRRFVQATSLIGLGLLTGCARLPFQTPAQVPRVGYLGARRDPAVEDEFRQGLREHGYVEGQNVEIVWRGAEGDLRVLPDLAAELVRLPVDVLVAQNNPTAVAARGASSTIPIVMALGDPIGTGLAASLGRPGGNVTGVTNLAPQLGAKRLELLKDTIPGLARVAVLWPPYNPVKVAEWAETESAGRTLGLEVQSLEVSVPDDIERAFAIAARDRAEGLIVFGDNLFTGSRAQQIVDLTAQHHLPTMYESRVYLELGGFMGYGPSFASLYRRAGYYVDRILKGARPEDLPIEQPREFSFIINLKTAQALGVAIPQHVLRQATEVLN
jgi:putative tryptophan/tyrosine transport system substrate-binding protein